MDHTVEHEDAHRQLIEDELRRASAVGPLVDPVVAAGANPTKAEFDALVTSHKSVLRVLRDSGLIPSV